MFSPNVSAQTSPSAPVEPGQTASLDSVVDIVVTARRQSERLQDVPVAVTAFGGEALAERRIVSQVDLQAATPGLTVRQTGSSDQLNYAIRGQSIDAFSYASPAVTSYFNEVQIGGAAATAFFDLASIQVLKGPQGTLFGRNATGGAVLYATQRPTLEFEGYLKGALGNYDDRELEGAVNLPIGSSVAVRAAGRFQKRDGFQRNLLLGNRPNSVDSRVGRLSLLIAPEGSGFENVTVGQYGRFRGRTGAVKIQNANGANGAPATYFDPVSGTTKPLVTNMRDVYQPGVQVTDSRVNALFNGIADYLNKQGQYGFYDVFVNSDQRRRGRQKTVTNTTSYDLGDATVKNIFGYNNVRSFESSDIDGSPYDFLRIGGGVAERDQGYTFGTKQWSNEIQVSGEAGSLKYIVGFFMSKEESYNRVPLRVTGDLGAPFMGPYDFTVTDKSKAGYAQLSYALTSRLNVTGGLRYTWEDVSIRQGDDSVLAIANLGKRKRKDDNPSWLAGVDYKVTDDLLLYFNQRGSWRTGGFNGTSGASLPDASTFKPETTYDFEVGAKFAGLIGSMRARLNIALYNQIIKDVQRAPYLNISALAGNVNKARVRGVEIDGSFDLTPWLQAGGAFTYTDAEYRDPRATVAGSQFVFGPYGDAPKYSGSAFGKLHHRLEGGGGEVALRGDFYAQSKFFYANLGDTLVPGARIPGYHIVNSRLEWNDMLGSPASAAFFVNNLFKEKYWVGGFPLGAVTGSNGRLPGTPRMYGVEVSVKF
ncbi:TonB-dependent receptor [Sphingomonas sp. ID0503]|uniref:TonB-dependent receptor n=1 Tax=Sphingomonas sp. ID0503 TaxID=3399691 RepID=UPI003AFA780E